MSISRPTQIMVLLFWVSICLVYYTNCFNHFYSFASNIDIQSKDTSTKIYKDMYKGSEKFLIDTPGCYIPNYSKTFNLKEQKFLKKTCGVRAVEVKKISSDKIELKIDKEKINTYSHGKTYQCCLRFASPSNMSGEVNLTNLEYSTCTPFKNGSRLQLEQEIVTVSCHSKLTKIYEDAYILLKKKIASKDEKKSNKNYWNVLIIGMDTMSRARLHASMPQTAQYLREHNWLDFRGYQKVGYNTFPNVMSLMTGMNITSIYKACAKGLDKCGKLLMWNKFKDANYITAYGEEFLRLPDTFSKYNGFSKPPTDHYMRPFFLTGESSTGNYVCTKKLPSVNHILNYVHQLTDAYKSQKYYGFFWINSCSHNLDNNPMLFDGDFVTFFKKMHDNGVMNNTFIIFVSDHGIRYGSMRVPVESYYEERLPMCSVWVPTKFRELFATEFTNMQLNQERLVTPYDLYLTMWDILKITQGSNEAITSEACALCNSLFREISAKRTCADAGVHEKWCTCHNMNAVDKNKSEVIRSIQVAEEFLYNRTSTTETTPCTECEKFKIKTILRTHSYKNPGEDKIYYVIAFVVVPGDIGYEVIVEKYEDYFSIVHSMDTITPYNTRGSCVVHPNDRGFCVCKKLKTCKRNS